MKYQPLVIDLNQPAIDLSLLTYHGRGWSLTFLESSSGFGTLPRVNIFSSCAHDRDQVGLDGRSLVDKLTDSSPNARNPYGNEHTQWLFIIHQPRTYSTNAYLLLRASCDQEPYYCYQCLNIMIFFLWSIFYGSNTSPSQSILTPWSPSRPSVRP